MDKFEAEYTRMQYNNALNQHTGKVVERMLTPEEELRKTQIERENKRLGLEKESESKD